MFQLQEAIDITYGSETDVEGNENEYIDSESGCYCSEDSNCSGESKGNSVGSIDRTLTLCPPLCFKMYMYHT